MLTLRESQDLLLSRKESNMGDGIRVKQFAREVAALTRTNQHQSETIGKLALELQGEGAQVARAVRLSEIGATPVADWEANLVAK